MCERTSKSSDPQTLRPTLPLAIEEHRADLRRLEWAERRACEDLLRAIERTPETRAAHERWTRARDRREVAEAKLEVLEAAHRSKKGPTR